MVCEDPATASNTITAVRTPAGVDSNDLLKHGRDRYALSLGGGIGELNGQAFRIGHLGSLNELEVMGMIGGIELVFADQQLGVKPGAGLLACQASFVAASAAKPPAVPALAAV
jgi:alanine-glyoxylate transaminase/serine-glyoxylate transaminase/serine-pyruvate transaminase